MWALSAAGVLALANLGHVPRFARRLLWLGFGIQSGSLLADLADSQPFMISSLSAPLANAMQECFEPSCLVVFLAGFVLISRSIKGRQFASAAAQGQ